MSERTAVTHSATIIVVSEGHSTGGIFVATTDPADTVKQKSKSVAKGVRDVCDRNSAHGCHTAPVTPIVGAVPSHHSSISLAVTAMHSGDSATTNAAVTKTVDGDGQHTEDENNCGT